MIARTGLWVAVALCITTTLTAQSPYITPGDNLVVEGIPPIPLSLKKDVALYTRARQAEFLSWHPVRREMLIATFFGDVAQIHQVRFPGGARTQLTFFEDRPTSGVSYQPTTGNYFIFRKDVGGDQNYQIYRYDMADGAVTLLTDGKSQNSAGVFSNAGDRIVYTSTRRTGKDRDLYIVDPLHPQTDHMVAQLEGGGWTALDWSPDDRRILVQEMISVNESYLWLVDARTGAKTLITPKEGVEKTAYSSARFRRDGSGIYIVTDRGSEFARLATIDLATGQFHVLTGAINWDVYQYDVSRDGRSLAVIMNEAGRTVLHLLDAATGRERQLPGRTQRLTGVFAVSWHRNGRVLGLSMDSGRSTADAYALDVTTGKLVKWTFSETGGVDTRQFVEEELIRWKSFDDRMISGFLYRPPARFTGKRPVIIDIHGGPEEQFQPYFLSQWNYYMNELGVALLFPNVRGSSGYGKTFVKLDDGVLRENAYRDIGALLDWIKTQPNLDADRIMVTGASYGGYMSLMTATRYADRIRCAVDIYGPSNLVTFLEHTAAYRQDWRRMEYGDERDSVVRAFLERTAPLNNDSSITKPLFVVQGANDPIVPPSESEQMIQAVRARGVPVWYLKAKDEGHGFHNKATADFQFYATVLLVRETLLR
jgi:dipeptidyl aminopeptidase/acylaminoacyl peptidase